jgi:hypothetical protein
MSHKNFCILPFIHLATTTEGTCRLCCKVSKHNVIVDDNGKPYNVNTHSIDEIWNSNHYRELRKRIWEDEQLPECSICFKEEETFYSDWSKTRDELPSKRRKENQKWLHKDQSKLKESVEEIISDPRIRYYDIRLGNLCNLKCRMCWPHFSSQIVKEQTYFAERGLPTHYTKYDVINWDAQKLWQSINNDLLSIEEITFVGGEPTLHDEMYELLEELVEKGASTNIRLKLTTNLTNLQTRFLKLFAEFKTVVINGSIDGVNTTNEYVRYPSDWTIIERNIDLILDTTALLTLTPVVQIYNIFNLEHLVKWYVDKWVDKQSGDRFVLDLDLLYDPNYLSVKLLNYEGKQKWYHEVYVPTIKLLDDTIQNIESYGEVAANYWRMIDSLRKRIVNIAQYMEVLRFDENDRLEFMIYSYEKPDSIISDRLHAYTKQLDNHRKQDINNIIPNFYEMTQ